MRKLWRSFRIWLAKVTAVDVGKADDALVPMRTAGTDLDRGWGDLRTELLDALKAWDTNPIAKRLVAIVTAYVIGGDGVRLRAPSYKLFNNYLRDFMTHPENRMMMRQADLCDELSRSGELFPILFMNSADGMATVRVMPASRIERIRWRKGDYEAEIYYDEVSDGFGEEGETWCHPRAARKWEKGDKKPISPIMLHYAVNRPVGRVRGTSDLAPILKWLKRYEGWLEDRVRLNAAVRAFLWFVRVPGHLVKAKAEQYRGVPAPGSVVVMEKDVEEWDVKTPNLRARDAESDGRAIRWMIVAGGPGLSLLDIGESETANLASAKTLGEQRRRFLRRRQAYFGWILADVAVTAWNRAVDLGLRRGRVITVADVEVGLPDIAPDDNHALALAAGEITEALGSLRGMVGDSSALRRLAVRLLLKFAGESISENAFEEIVGGAFAAPGPGGSEAAVAIAEVLGAGLPACRGGNGRGGGDGHTEDVRAGVYQEWRSVL